MKRILKEPPLYFLIVGAAFFVAFGLKSGPKPATKNQIEISAGLVDHLTTMFSRTWQRPPTKKELQELLREHIREEVAYREAMALGLDRDDSVIRTRLRQKLEFLSDETTDIQEPTNAELEALMLESPDKYAIEPEFSFVQVYINSDRHKDDVNGFAEALLERLRTSDISIDAALESSDATMLPSRMELSPLWMIQRTFGSQFAEALLDQPTGRWIGPVASGFGLHLIHIGETVPGRAPELEEVRDAVLRDWQAASREKALDEFYERTTAEYKIVIEDEVAAGLLENE